MADTVSNRVILDGPSKVIVVCTGSSDGTGEVDAVKIDLSTLEAYPDGRLPTRLSIQYIEYDVKGYNFVALEFDRTTDVPIAKLSGSGVLVFEGGLANLASQTGDTGDVVLTTNGNVAGNSYTLVICAKKKYD